MRYGRFRISDIFYKKHPDIFRIGRQSDGEFEARP